MPRNPWIDAHLSWKAKGLMGYFLAHQDEMITQVDLVKVGADGRESVGSGVRELVRAGYLRTEQMRDCGRIVNQWYVVADDVVGWA